MHEARLEDSGSGRAPATDGWFVVNVRDAMWLTSETPGPLQPSGAECSFESPFAEFAELGIRLHVLPPGEPNGLGHTESQQEAFLVLSGSRTLLVEGEERTLGPWDFFHSPAGTEVAARFAASVTEATSYPDAAYSGCVEPSSRRAVSGRPIGTACRGHAD
jgi:mannose-6-phosphate isomerase-like protein (cupin superfamily)